MTIHTRAQQLGLVAGLVVALVPLLAPAPAELDTAAWRVFGVGTAMAIWWLSEALPVSATALVPLIAFPLLGVMGTAATAAPYANPVIFLFLGGFLLARGLEASGLHRRLSLAILTVFGTRPAGIVAGFMAATAALSMWINNTATVAMMAPLALSVVAVAAQGGDPSSRRLAVPLLLGVAWSSSLGGVATLVGTAPNALLAGFAAETLGHTVTFASWLAIGLPVALLTLPLAWLLLVRAADLPSEELLGGAGWIREQRTALGGWSRHERTVAIILGGTALSWVFSAKLQLLVPGLSDAGIAITGALLLFAAPVGGGRRALSWPEAERISWSVLVLVGGGLSLAVAVDQTGLARWIGGTLTVLGTPPAWVMVLAVTTLVIFLTELTSNTATAAAMLPVVASVAVAAGHDPMLLAVPAAIAASCAFMLPVATPPNAIVFASGEVPLRTMARYGWRMNLMSVAVIAVVTLVGW